MERDEYFSVTIEHRKMFHNIYERITYKIGPTFDGFNGGGFINACIDFSLICVLLTLATFSRTERASSYFCFDNSQRTLSESSQKYTIIRKQGICRVIIMYRHGPTAHAIPPSTTWPTANIEEEIALVITRYLGPTNSAAESFLLLTWFHEFLLTYGATFCII